MVKNKQVLTSIIAFIILIVILFQVSAETVYNTPFGTLEEKINTNVCNERCSFELIFNPTETVILPIDLTFNNNQIKSAIITINGKTIFNLQSYYNPSHEKGVNSVYTKEFNKSTQPFTFKKEKKYIIKGEAIKPPLANIKWSFHLGEWVLDPLWGSSWISTSSVVLNSSSGFNFTTDNLIVNVLWNDYNPSFKYIYNWYMNDSSIALLNLPIEADDGNESYKTKDYSPFKNNGTTLGVVFSPNTGHDGFGAYTFDGINDSISVPNSNVLDLTSNFTIELWFKPNLMFNRSADYYQGLVDKGNYQMYLDKSDGKLKFYLDSNTVKSWSAIGSGTDASVLTLSVYNGELYAGGDFITAGGINANYTAKWNGTNWSALGSGTNNSVLALAVYNGELYVGGTFTSAGGVSANHIAKWNGTNWSAVGSGVDETVYTLAVYNNELYAGGFFITAGGTSANRTAKWNGTNWSALGSGTSASVRALSVYNGELYAGGAFTTAGGVSANRMAKWNGTNWSAMSSGVGDTVYTLAVYNGELYAGGSFTTASAMSANYTAKWNGTDWSALGSGMDYSVYSLAVYNGELYVGGQFISAGGMSANYTAKWNGTNWSALSSETDSDVYTFARYNGELYAGGFFTIASGVTANRIAKWSSGGKEISSNTSSFAPNWQQVVVTYNHNNLSVYINGSLENNITTFITPSTNNLALLLGTTYGSRSGGYSSSGSEYFNGKIDEVRVYNRSLSSSQIQTLFNNQPNITVSQELTSGNVWKACVTPNDGISDGTEKCSNNLTVMPAPTQVEVYNLSLLFTNTSHYAAFRFFVRNTAPYPNIFNWGFNTGVDHIISTIPTNLIGNKTFFVYIEKDYVASGTYNVIANSSTPEKYDSETIEAVIK